MSLSLSLLDEARALKLKKGLSQNFLVDQASVDAIVDSVRALPQQLPLVEIGPGAGFLTRTLLELGHPTTVIEVDADMVSYLNTQRSQWPAFELIHRDVRQVDLASLLGAEGVIVGNLPYHLTGPILFQLMGELYEATHPVRNALNKAVLMVQKEVGDRLTARPGDSAYGQLSVQVQFWFEVLPVCVVPAKDFYPPPKVDSMVVQLTPRTSWPVAVQDLKTLHKVVKAGFMHRRKTLANNLKLASLVPSTEAAAELLASLTLSPQARAQDVSIDHWGALANALTDNR